jgi:hypothetical protein
MKKACGERGGAMVELVVLMLVFIPLIMLPMYFQDALRYKLDTQEAVYSTAWDFAFGKYDEETADNIAPSITSANRRIFANLWSGNRNDKRNPAGPWADFNWKSRIDCSANKDFGSDAYGMLAKAYHNDSEVGTKGGLVTCKGTISVTNHYIPRVFLQEFASKNLFDPGRNELSYPEVKFGVMVDPWCIHDPADAEKLGDGNEAFYKRANFVWQNGPAAITYNVFRGLWYIFAVSMMDRISLTALFIDDPTKLRLSSLHFPDKRRSVEVSGGRSRFWVSPYEDGNDNLYKKTFDKRETNYLGCQNFGPNCD